LAIVPYIKAHNPKAATYSIASAISLMRVLGKQLQFLNRVSKAQGWVEPLEAGKFLAAAFSAALNPHKSEGSRESQGITTSATPNTSKTQIEGQEQDRGTSVVIVVCPIESVETRKHAHCSKEKRSEQINRVS
jgi:hypothetical protein